MRNGTADHNPFCSNFKVCKTQIWNRHQNNKPPSDLSRARSDKSWADKKSLLRKQMTDRTNRGI